MAECSRGTEYIQHLDPRRFGLDSKDRCSRLSRLGIIRERYAWLDQEDATQSGQPRACDEDIVPFPRPSRPRFENTDEEFRAPLGRARGALLR